MSRFVFYLFIFSFLNLWPTFVFSAEKKLCLSRFDPTQNDFNFEIQPETQCKSSEKEIELKKEKFGILIFLPLKEVNPESRNEEKYGRSDSLKQ